VSAGPTSQQAALKLLQLTNLLEPSAPHTLLLQIRDLVRSRRYDVFLNLCDGAYDEDRAGIEVVEALHR
jgi:hypothetical protein